MRKLDRLNHENSASQKRNGLTAGRWTRQAGSYRVAGHNKHYFVVEDYVARCNTIEIQ